MDFYLNWAEHLLFGIGVFSVIFFLGKILISVSEIAQHCEKLRAAFEYAAEQQKHLGSPFHNPQQLEENLMHLFRTLRILEQNVEALHTGSMKELEEIRINMVAQAADIRELTDTIFALSQISKAN